MAKAVQKVTLSPSRDIPFDKLVLSQSNMRRIKTGVSVEELADNIGRRGLLQGLNVRPVLDADGAETGVIEIPAGKDDADPLHRAGCLRREHAARGSALYRPTETRSTRCRD